MVPGRRASPSRPPASRATSPRRSASPRPPSTIPLPALTSITSDPAPLNTNTTSGSSASSGTSGTSGGGGSDITGLDTQVLYFDGDDNPTGDHNHTWNKTNGSLRIMTTQNDETSSLANLILGNAVSQSLLTSGIAVRDLAVIKGINPSGSDGVYHSAIKFQTGGNWAYKNAEYTRYPSRMSFWTSPNIDGAVPTPGIELESNSQIRLGGYYTSGSNDEGGFRFVSSSEFKFLTIIFDIPST